MTARWTWACLAAALGACSPPRGADIGEVAEGLKVCAHGTTTPGVDVSHHNGTINWSSVKGAGIGFAFMKATENINFVDPEFINNWNGADRSRGHRRARRRGGGAGRARVLGARAVDDEAHADRLSQVPVDLAGASTSTDLAGASTSTDLAGAGPSADLAGGAKADAAPPFGGVGRDGGLNFLAPGAPAGCSCELGGRARGTSPLAIALVLLALAFRVTVARRAARRRLAHPRR